MKDKTISKTFALEFATNMLGHIKPEIKERLEKVIKRPNQKNWDDTYSIIINGSGPTTTLWQAVIKVDWKCPTRKPYGEPWSYIPSRETIVEAIKTAIYTNGKISN